MCIDCPTLQFFLSLLTRRLIAELNIWRPYIFEVLSCEGLPMSFGLIHSQVSQSRRAHQFCFPLIVYILPNIGLCYTPFETNYGTPSKQNEAPQLRSYWGSLRCLFTWYKILSAHIPMTSRSSMALNISLLCVISTNISQGHLTHINALLMYTLNFSWFTFPRCCCNLKLITTILVPRYNRVGSLGLHFLFNRMIMLSL